MLSWINNSHFVGDVLYKYMHEEFVSLMVDTWHRNCALKFQMLIQVQVLIMQWYRLCLLWILMCYSWWMMEVFDSLLEVSIFSIWCTVSWLIMKIKMQYQVLYEVCCYQNYCLFSYLVTCKFKFYVMSECFSPNSWHIFNF